MRILCFGDSNTWGQKALSDERFKNRWPVVLQSMLKNHTIIEEGLNGRTFNSFSGEDGKYKDGLAYFSPCVKSHNPLDIIIIALGANDSKLKYNNSANKIYEDMLKYVSVVKKEQPHAQLLFVSSIKIADNIAWRDDFEGANEKIDEFINQLMRSEFNALDMRDLQTGEDGLHLTEQSHGIIAKRIYDFISKNFINA